MSNNDRVKGRIERDIARKADNKANKNKQYNDLGEIFTINNHRKAVKLCKKGKPLRKHIASTLLKMLSGL